MKAGLIRCQKTEDICPATTCFKVMLQKTVAFEGVDEDIEVVGVTTCGGCPGEKAVIRAAEMVRRGADTIVLSSCITRANPGGGACPHMEKNLDAIRRTIGDSIRIVDHTH